MDFQPYPFEKLQALIKDIPIKAGRITLTIGEPQFPTPRSICNALKESVDLLNKYPKTTGEDYLKQAMLGFVKRRFNVDLDTTMLIPTFGTREVLFNFPQFYLFDKKSPVIAHPNPFYQIYEGASIASRAKTIYMNLTQENNFMPSLTKEQMQKCDLVILNSPNNPTGATMSLEALKQWVKNALEFDFLLLNDECYSEIYSSEKPTSILEASVAVGNTHFRNILSLNSISKRSSAPGLRSGFIAGDSEVLKAYMQYRTYIGCASPLPLQKAASVAWSDEAHTESSRIEYAKNLKLAKEILCKKISNLPIPKETFYVWLPVKDDLAFTRNLLEQENILVLPGSFLSRTDVQGENPGSNFVRLALVYEEAVIKDALLRISKWI
ncbi:succinyldiaminopimelate transaminase [Helicobacter turcicus]|uniref:Succinyldiaminopimelate transaminase n=1 Tax=Helicobacter turcicus TaxID=2867412 RepID=A0ABS7JLD4_9HELI|nr:succinyldiaminopimelate transaminase [Helicobacter turcicus]MBX7490194.1 succinyldiaminopimelate transaminase [Helicobacter turcicus]MBX7545227.1 succinyldiaminopimelate transaminase [Helicobacter turcicus]